MGEGNDIGIHRFGKLISRLFLWPRHGLLLAIFLQSHVILATHYLI